MKTLYLSLLSLLLLSSCTEKVEVELDETEEKVVIEAVLSTNGNTYVKVTKTSNYFSSDFPPYVTNALVEINDGPNNYVFEGSGVYKPPVNFKALIDKTYHLKVVVNGKQYTASSHLHPLFSIRPPLQERHESATALLPEGYAIFFQSMDKRTDLVYTQVNYGYVYSGEYWGSFIYGNDQVVKNQYAYVELPFFRPQTGDFIFAEFRSMGKAEAEYLLALEKLYSGAPGPFASPPANPPTNIKGGALGYFCASDVRRLEMRVP